MNKNDGDLAERLIMLFLRHEEKREVFMSQDKYDTKKDMSYSVDGDIIGVEVKLQTVFEHFIDGAGDEYPAVTVPILSKTVHSNQLLKCLNVDRLIFVTRPSLKREYVGIFEAPPPGKRHFVVSQNKGDKRLIAALRLGTTKRLATINDEDTLKKFRIK